MPRPDEPPPATITVRCVGCKSERELTVAEAAAIPPGEVPMCSTCYLPMTAVMARSAVGLVRVHRSRESR